MEKVGFYSFETETYLLDFRGKITLPMIGNYLLHAASNHAGTRGFGFGEMSKNHTTWVLSRLAIEMIQYPQIGDRIKIATWIDEVGKLFTNRCFEITNSNGIVLGYARSIWAAIDVESRKPSLLDVERLSQYITDKPCPIHTPSKIPSVGETFDSKFEYSVKYSDLDINGHLNSIKYIEHLIDLFELDLFKTKQISRFEIAYMAEGQYNMQLNLLKKKISEDEFLMEIHNNEKSIAKSKITWK